VDQNQDSIMSGKSYVTSGQNGILRSMVKDLTSTGSRIEAYPFDANFYVVRGFDCLRKIMGFRWLVA
jgi:hypothetical protein